MKRDRRSMLGLVAALAALPVRTWAAGAPRIAWLSIESPNPQSPFLLAFRNGLRGLGYREGDNLALDIYWGEGSLARVKDMMPAIIATRPEVLVVASGLAMPTVIEARAPMPVLFVYSADVVIGKLVDSWSRPGVNRTGVSFFSTELIPKRLEYMRVMLPRMKRVAIVGWPPHAGEYQELQVARASAEQMGLTHSYHGVANADELDAALEAIGQWRADAVLVFAGAIASNHPDRFARFAARSRIPAASAWAPFAERGNLMTYGPVLKESHARLASFADRLLKGAKAAEMPVELPTQLELVINLQAARALGVEVPQALLLRADRVIE
jgi:putative ABC transport system substrate-binding protein